MRCLPSRCRVRRWGGGEFVDTQIVFAFSFGAQQFTATDDSSDVVTLITVDRNSCEGNVASGALESEPTVSSPLMLCTTVRGVMIWWTRTASG